MTARVEGYWKDFDDLVVGRLETEAERAARVARYDFPAELASSIPTEALSHELPRERGARAAWGFDVLLQKRAAPGARLSGWASYTYASARRDEYGSSLPFEYDRPHAATLVGSWRFSPKWELAATLRAYSGFPRTPVRGPARGRARRREEGRSCRLSTPRGATSTRRASAGVSNLNSARLPVFVRLDLRAVVEAARGARAAGSLYLDVINATNRKNAGQIASTLEYDPVSTIDQPRLVEETAVAIPFLPVLRRALPVLSAGSAASRPTVP